MSKPATQVIVRERVQGVAVAPGNRLRGNDTVPDGFFNRFDDGAEALVHDCRTFGDAGDSFKRFGRNMLPAVGGGKGDSKIAAAIVPDRARAPQRERGAHG